MNPLQEMHAIIEGMLFRIGDERMSVPEHVSLVLLVDGKTVQYSIQNSSTKQVNLLVTMVDFDVQEDDE
jgi:hypothetical protein